jgi:predicted nuclease of restriction endonuclease-like RecB superfamily
VFGLAAERRRSADGGFDRAAIVGEVAPRFGLDPAEIEEALYSDLRGAHQLLAFRRMAPTQLLERYEVAQRQAVLLRAVRLQARVWCSSPSSYRALFNKLKFRRLLHRIARQDDGSYRIDIDGPFSLFESVTKYGMNLALCLPALEACDALELQASLRWGKGRQALGFTLSRRMARSHDESAPPLPDEVAELIESVERLETGWHAQPCSEILDLPGVGVCVPDLVFEHVSRPRVHLEVMGYWSRDAVWRRVELVERGLGARILFAVSSRLRVSEDVLPPGEPAALYVYKGTMSARSVLRKVEELARG